MPPRTTERSVIGKGRVARICRVGRGPGLPADFRFFPLRSCFPQLGACRRLSHTHDAPHDIVGMFVTVSSANIQYWDWGKHHSHPKWFWEVLVILVEPWAMHIQDHAEYMVTLSPLVANLSESIAK